MYVYAEFGQIHKNRKIIDGLLLFCVFDDIVNVLWWTGPQRRAAALFAQQRAEAPVRRGVCYTVFPSQEWLKKIFLEGRRIT